MVTITLDLSEAKTFLRAQRAQGAAIGQQLMAWTRCLVVGVVNGLLKAELALVLERERYERADSADVNYRNGSRPRGFSLLGLGRLIFRVPRDRQGAFQTKLLPPRVRRASELEAFIAELFLAGLSTRDVERVSLKHFGEKISSKEVSRVVAHVSSELDGFRHRSLADRRFKFLFLDGSYFKVRRGDRVDRVPFLAVVGIAEDDKVEVLGLDCGDRERCDVWEGLLRNLIERGLRADAVELGIMDGLPGLEALFRRLFPRAVVQRCQVHAKRNAIARVTKKDRGAFKADLDRVFYASSESAARKAWHSLKEHWSRSYPSAVQTIEKDLESLLTFFQFAKEYWPTIRTTNPIERLNKEFKRRTKAMEVTGGEENTYRILSYVALTLNWQWRKYSLSAGKFFYTLKAA